MIIDTHQHFYDPGTPNAKGPEDYKLLALPEGITGALLLSYPEFGLNLAAEEPLVVGVVGRMAVNDSELRAKINQWAANPLFLGIRPTGQELEEVPDHSSGFLSDMNLLAEKNLVLDVFRVCDGGFGGPKSFGGFTGSRRSLAMLEKVADSVPHLRIIVDHIAHCPIDGGPMPPAWKENFQRMVSHPNIYLKVSGLMERTTWRSDKGGFPDDRAPEMLGYYRPTLDALWEMFGEDRLLYGSNWPVCEHAGDRIGEGLRIVRRYFAEKGLQAYTKFFWQNSIKVYRWKPRLASQR
jgi:L-fuconolactonase